MATEAAAETNHLLFSFLSNWRETRLKARVQVPACWMARPPPPHQTPLTPPRSQRAPLRWRGQSHGLQQESQRTFRQGHQIVKTQAIGVFRLKMRCDT